MAKKKNNDIEVFKKSMFGTLIGFGTLIMLIILTWASKKLIIWLKMDNDLIINALTTTSGAFGILNLALLLGYSTKNILKILLKKKK